MSEVVLLRNSERSTYRRCRQKWQWSYVDGLAPPRSKGALAFGSLAHEALAAYYKPGRKRGPHPAKTFLELYDEAEDDFAQWDEEGNRIPARQLGEELLVAYIEKYGKDSHLEIIHPEQTFAIDVYDKQGRYLVTLVGTFDAVYRNLMTGRIGLLEHKTGKAIVEVQVNSGYGEQGFTYWWAANLWLRHEGVIKEHDLLDAVLFNWLRKALPDKRPKNPQGHALNKDGSVSKRQPKPLFARQEMIFGGENAMARINQRIRMEAWEMAQVKAGKLPVYKNPTKDCSWECPFYAPCEVQEMGGDYQSILDLEFVERDPYEDHDLEDEE